MLYLFIVIFVIYVLFFVLLRLGWENVPEYFSEETPGSLKVSVIIVARNEENNIINLLNGLENQSYSKSFFEVIIVDDCSEDRTIDKIESFGSGSELKLSVLKLKNEPTHKQNKKGGIEYAMRYAEGDLIILTDADCTLQKGWISSIVSFYHQYKPKMIIGPVGYFTDNSFLSYFQALDFLAMQGVSCCSAGLNKPLLCNGANIAYEKTLFNELNVYEKDDIASGDDMFMLHKAYSSYPDKVKYLKAKSAIVKTDPCKTWKALFQQRLRWAGKVKYFDSKESILVLFFLLVINVLVLVLAFFSLFETIYLKYFIIAVSTKMLTDIFFLWPVAKFFRQSHMLSLFLAVQFVHFIYMAVVGILSNILPYSWKGRKIKK